MVKYPSFFDPEQERMLVTAMVHLPESILEVTKCLPNSEVIQDINIRKIYDVVCEIHMDGNDVSPLSVMQRLISKGDYSIIGKANLSLEFEAMTPSDMEGILATAETVISMSRRQMAYNFSHKLMASLMDEKMTDEQLGEKVFQIYEAITLQGGKSFEKTSKVAADGALRMIDEARKKRRAGGVSGIPTGSNKLDRELGGWQKDEVIILSGRPGTGKTSAALDFTLTAAKFGHPVGFISMEMDAENLNFRLAAAESGVPYSSMIKGDYTDEEWIRIETALAYIGTLPIYYYDDVSVQNVKKMEAVLTEWCRKYGIEMAVIDYIQYLQTDISGSSYDKITEVSKSVKRMQRKLKIPFIALAQLSRDTEKRADPRPIMEDLKESGQLEQDASTIIGLFYPEYYIRKGKDVFDETKEGEVPFPDRAYCYYLLKRRSGGHARVDRFVHMETNRFSDTMNFDQAEIKFVDDIFKPKGFFS